MSDKRQKSCGHGDEWCSCPNDIPPKLNLTERVKAVMTPDSDVKALAREACGCFICKSDLGQTVMGITDRWKDPQYRKKLIEANNFQHRQHPADSWAGHCNLEAIERALLKHEQAVVNKLVDSSATDKPADTKEGA